ncbi:N1-acetylpolyamine oxidase [Colletotrichum abscissum]|uniref:N1-acetylpolyamine oxidase n=1 Tax=Colletotrichum abscissum TaxID=1671311 RepID=A0A9P9XNJ1_9PEZI|nr:N1-acetylpolyamine oxidase [Colletotrichum abscissum]
MCNIVLYAGQFKESDISPHDDNSGDFTETIISSGATPALSRRLPARPLLANPGPIELSRKFPLFIERSCLFRPESGRDWEVYKETIHKLYVEDNLPLKETMEVMSQRHWFLAT